MQEFEKWWFTKGVEWRCIEDEDVAKSAWKAALKWALTQACPFFDNFNPLIDVQDIEDELNG